MELRHLRAFLAIAEEGSITAASKRLFATQPAVTRQLAQLEQSLGTQLFIRIHSGVTLTDSGRRLEPEARRILGLADAVIEGCRDDRSTLGGQLVISIPEEGLGALTPVVLAAYRAAHPNVEIIIEVDTPYTTIDTLARRDNPYDVALWGLDFGDDRFHVDCVYSERIDLLVSDRCEMASANAPLPSTDILELPMVNPSAFMKEWAKPFLLVPLRNGSTPRFDSAEPFDHFSEIIDGVVDGRAVTGVTRGTAPVPGTAQVPIDANLTSTIGVITPASEQRQHVRNFGAIAAHIGHELHELVPFAQPPGDRAQRDAANSTQEIR